MTGLAAGDTLYICGTNILTMTSGTFSDGEKILPSSVTIRGDYPTESGTVFCGSIWQRTGYNAWIGPDANGVYHNRSITNSGNSYELAWQIDGSVITRLGYTTLTTWTGSNGYSSFVNGTNFLKTVDGTAPSGHSFGPNAYGWYFNVAGKTNISFIGLKTIGPMFPNSGMVGASNNTLTACTVSDDTLNYIVAGVDGWTWSGCDVSQSRNGCFYFANANDPTLGARNWTITNCFIHDTGFGRYSGGDAHGIGVWNAGSGHIFSHITLTNIGGTAIEFYGGNQTNMTVEYPRISGTSAGLTDGHGIAFTGTGNKQGFKIYGGIISDLATNDTQSYQGIGVGGAITNYVEIYNMTISNANVALRLNAASSAVNGKILNNIVINPRLNFLSVIGVGTNSNTVIDYNLFYTNTPIVTPFSVSVTGGLLHDSHAVFANPLLLGDYSLSVNSPAIASGIAVSGYTFDFAGRVVQNPPSIGAFEPGAIITTSVLQVGQLFLR